MHEAFFFRLLSSDGKASALTDALSAANEGGVINAVVSAARRYVVPAGARLAVCVLGQQKGTILICRFQLGRTHKIRSRQGA